MISSVDQYSDTDLIWNTSINKSMEEEICGFELDTTDLTGLNISTSPCERSVWNNGSCFWHSKSEKDAEEVVRRWQNEEPERIDGLYLSGVEIKDRIDFSKKILFGVDFSSCDLTGATFSGSKLHYADFTDATLVGTTFSDDVIAKEATFDGIDGLNADFRNSDFSNAYFNNSDLVSSYFHGTKLAESEFQHANLQESNFESTIHNKKSPEKAEEITGPANLRATNLSNANLYGAKLNGTNIERAVFAGADIRDTDLRYCKTHRTDFRNAQANSSTKFGHRAVYELEADRQVSRTNNKQSTVLAGLRNAVHRFIMRISEDRSKLKTESLWKSIQVYWTYRRIFEENPDPEQVRKFGVAEKDAKRKFELEKRNWTNWAKWSIYRSLMYYGESPVVVLLSGGVTISIFSLIYLFFGVKDQDTVYQFCMCYPEAIWSPLTSAMILSLGEFFPGSGSAVSSVGFGKLVSQLEAAIGTLYISIFAFVLGRRASR